MDILSIFILSLLQGFTEFLPVSSSAHLILFSELFGNSNQDITVDVFAHFGTLLAVIWYFREELKRVIKTYKFYEINNLGNCLILSTLPILFVGFISRDFIEASLRTQNVIIFSMIFFGVLLLIFEYFKGKKTLNDLNWKDSIIIGFFQVFALMPGASRSAVVIMGAMYLGYRARDALKVSFLLAVPTLAMIFLGENIILGFRYNINFFELISVTFFSFLTALLTIHFFLNLIDRIGLMPFVIYRFILAGILFFI